MPLARYVVITGIGVVSPIGIGKAAMWDSLRAQRSGVGAHALVLETDFPVKFAGEIRDFDPKQYVKPRKSLKVMCREIQMGFSAATLAMEDAGLSKEAVDHDRFGVVYGGDMFYGELQEVETVFRNCMVDGRFDYTLWGKRAMTDIFPLWMLKYLPNMVACHLGISQDARGPNNTITLGEASSLLAMIESVRVVERGDADVMITGGTGSRLNETAMLFRGDGNLSHRGEDPAGASRPFDAHRDGMVNGEGAAALIIESGDHARARGANVLASVLGCGQSFEPRSNGEAPTGDGLRRSIERALAEAVLDAREVGHVNANGLSTVEDDAAEARAIHAMLGGVPVTAPKSFFGNLAAGGGAVELAATILGFEHQEVPVTLNYEFPDDACPVNVVHGDPLPLPNSIALAVNQSGTGQAAAVLIARP